jgi:hypothetical protein
MHENSNDKPESIKLIIIENFIIKFNSYINQKYKISFFQKNSDNVNKFLHDTINIPETVNVNGTFFKIHTQEQYDVLKQTFTAFDYVGKNINNIYNHPNISQKIKQFIKDNQQIILLIYNELNSTEGNGNMSRRLKDKLLEEKKQLINSGENTDAIIAKGQQTDGSFLGGRKSRSNKRKLRRTKTNRVKSRRTNKRFI